MDGKKEQDDIIQKNYVRLAKTLEAQKLLGFLYQEGVLTSSDKEQISALNTSEEKAEKLLDILHKKRKDGVKMLIKALLLSGVQRFLGNELLESVNWSEEDMKNFKLELEGKIDQQQMQEANMAMLKQENNQLKAMKDEYEKTIKELTERLKEKDEKITALEEKLKDKNGEEGRLRQTKLCRTPAFVHGRHQRSKSDAR